jgi:hypothetical protein
LIVFLKAIREILKKEIYGRDKAMFLRDENKGGVEVVITQRQAIHESA